MNKCDKILNFFVSFNFLVVLENIVRVGKTKLSFFFFFLKKKIGNYKEVDLTKLPFWLGHQKCSFLVLPKV